MLKILENVTIEELPPGPYSRPQVSPSVANFSKPPSMDHLTTKWRNNNDAYLEDSD